MIQNAMAATILMANSLAVVLMNVCIACMSMRFLRFGVGWGV
jgi:hypothetical protein